MFAQEFIRNGLLGGSAVAVASGLVGYFVVLRAQVFAGDALGHVAFTGVLAAALAGIDLRIGLFTATMAIGLLFARIGDRARTDDVAIGVVFSWVLGLGALFLDLFNTGAGGGNGVIASRTLFGSVFTPEPKPDRDSGGGGAGCGRRNRGDRTAASVRHTRLPGGRGPGRTGRESCVRPASSSSSGSTRPRRPRPSVRCSCWAARRTCRSRDPADRQSAAGAGAGVRVGLAAICSGSRSPTWALPCRRAAPSCWSPPRSTSRLSPWRRCGRDSEGSRLSGSRRRPHGGARRELPRRSRSPPGGGESPARELDPRTPRPCRSSHRRDGDDGLGAPARTGRRPTPDRCAARTPPRSGARAPGRCWRFRRCARTPAGGRRSVGR